MKTTEQESKHAYALFCQQWYQRQRSPIFSRDMEWHKDTMAADASVQRQEDVLHTARVFDSMYTTKTAASGNEICYAVPVSELPANIKRKKDGTYNLRSWKPSAEMSRYIVMGQHARGATWKLFTEKGNEDEGMWLNQLDFHIVFYDPTSTEDVAMLAHVTHADNLKVSKADTFYDELLKIRTTFGTVTEQRASGGRKSTTTVMQEVKAFHSGVSDFMGKYRIASLKGKDFDKVAEFLQGKAGGKKKKIVKSGSHFAHIGNLPAGVISSFVDRLHSGKWTGSVFLQQCKNIKAKLQLRHAIYWYLVQRGLVKEGPPLGYDNRAVNINFSYDTVLKDFPSLGVEFIVQWSGVCTNYNITTGKTMWKLTEEVQKKVAEAVAFDQAQTLEERAELMNQKVARVLPLLFGCCASVAVLIHTIIIL
jgi:hypothetical protein